jgi:hypothetical protein
MFFDIVLAASIVVLFRTLSIDNMTFTGIQGIIVFWCCITVCWSYINVQESTAGSFGFMVFNATFNNISIISRRSVLLMEETGVPKENHQPVASH